MFKKSKGSADAKVFHKKFQDALWEAENSPDKRADFSECGIDTLSPQIIAACHLRKESLLLCNNMIKRIPPSISTMEVLKILDLHGNLLEDLPNEICQLSSLVILNLEGNHLKSLPPSIGDLRELQTLNVKDNRLTSIPKSIGTLSHLRTLNISKNEITHLPLELSSLLVLESFIFDQNPIIFPFSLHSGSFMDGSMAMEAICKEAGKKYVPPSQHLLDVISSSRVETKDDILLQAKHAQEEEIRALLAHKDAIDLSRQEEAEVARKAQQEQERQLEQILNLKTVEKHEFATHLASKTQEEENQFRSMDAERKRVLEDFTSLIRLADEEENSKAQKLLQEFERIRHDPVKLQALINENDTINKAILHRAVAMQASRDAAIEVTRIEQEQNDQLAVDGVMRKEEMRAMAARQLAVYQEQIDNQMQNFLDQIDGVRVIRNLEMGDQMRKDLELATGARINSEQKQRRNLEETKKIEEEISRLNTVVSELKLQKQEEKIAFQMARRSELETQLATLKADYERRITERVAHLIKIDEADQRNFRAYWEAKLQYALNHLGETAESRCDPVALSILTIAGLGIYAPVFARHKVDAIVLPILCENDLRSMGINAVGDRVKILTAIQEFYSDDALKSVGKKIDHEDMLKKCKSSVV